MGRAEIVSVWAGARVAVLSPTPTHPQDFGNRKRIFRICNRYAEEGARVTFIHYPAELEWRQQIPFRAERAMSAAWAQHFTIAPTRRLHDNPAGSYHSIDEWWDKSIGEFLTWLFSVESFDVFIVNYSWLSKALDCAPPTTFKILDTHDVFSGRREMLESLGLNPEFFYTTEAQERIALARADLVWAIKQQEAVQLAEMTEVPVLALPHLEPFRALDRPKPDPQGYLRIGVIGARNNVNRMNITEFLETAEPVFRDAFAPVRVMIAGSVCELLEGIDSPFVELVGFVENVEDFYRSVDCVAIPMRRSTGLKIKTGEALSLGLPVISLAHAFEGYEPANALHGLNDFEDMARAIVDLSFAPRARLETLAMASQQAHRKTSVLVAKAFRRSDTLALEKRRLIVVAVDSRAFVNGSIFNLALKSLFEPLRESASVATLVVAGKAGDVEANADAVAWFRRVIVADDLPGAGERHDALSALGVDVIDAGAVLARMRPTILIADALHPALSAADLPDAAAVFRTEMIAMSAGSAPFDIPRGGYNRVFLSAPDESAEIAVLVASCNAEFKPSPVFWRSSAAKFRSAPDRSSRISVALLGRADSHAVAMAAGMARAWRMEPHIVSGIAQTVPAGGHTPCLAADGYVAAIVAGSRPPPTFAIDLSGSERGLPLCRELLDRLHVPVVSTSPVGLHRSLLGEDLPLQASTERELWNALRSLALDPPALHAHARKHVWLHLERDRGWVELWRRCAKLLDDADAQFA